MLHRNRFPALDSETLFLDNAGGSQLPRCVIDAFSQSLIRGYAQVGGDYEPSARAARLIRRAHDVVKSFLNAHGRGEVILGSSATALCHLAANAYADARAAAIASGDTSSPAATRDEIIVATAGHEANVGPWTRLAARGFTIKLWPTELDSDGCFRPRLSTLKSLLSPRTRLVAFPQVSNILGEVWDAKAVAAAAHAAGARVAIDGVACAPHHAPDIAELGCDWYVFSSYKVFGPHMGALFGTREALAELTGPNHFFIPRDELPRKFEVGGVSHEGAAAISALWDHVCDVADADTALDLASPAARAVFARAFALMAAREQALQAPLIDALRAHPRLRIVGPDHSTPSRVATIAFVHDAIPSGDIAKAANADGLGIRFGHFYSRRLLEELSAPSMGDAAVRLVGGVDQGVIRASLLYYNDESEVQRLATYLRRYQ